MSEYQKVNYTNNKEKILETRRKLHIKKSFDKNNDYIPSPKSHTWKKSDSLREYFESAGPSLHIKDLSDWYRISRTQIIGAKGI
jgi:hypothetical protein